MALEIEAKMRIADLTRVADALKLAGATPVTEHHETNIFFDTPESSLLAGGKGLRLRIDREPANGRTTRIITFKGPRQSGPLKTREETEVIVDSEPSAIALLQCLGYRRVLTFEKIRRSWKLGDCKVELDELPLIGTFVEIEGPGDAEVMRVREQLGLSGTAIEMSSYASMLVRYLKANGIASREVRFEKAAT